MSSLQHIPLLGSFTRALLWASAGLAIGLLLRYQLIQPVSIGSLCSAANAPGWCQMRTGIIVFGLSYGGWSIMGFISLGISLWLDGAASRRALALALLCGGITLPLYATASGAVILLGGILRALHTGTSIETTASTPPPTTGTLPNLPIG